MNWNLPLCCFLFGLFVFVFLFYILFVFVLCFCFVLCFGDDMVTVHRTTYRSFTSSLLRPLNRRRPTYQLIPIGSMQGVRCPHGSVGRASFLIVLTHGSVVVRLYAGPQVSLKTVSRRKATGSGKKKRALDMSHIFRLELVSMWFLKMLLSISFSSGEATY